jgi:hypothetical protein
MSTYLQAIGTATTIGTFHAALYNAGSDWKPTGDPIGSFACNASALPASGINWFDVDFDYGWFSTTYPDYYYFAVVFWTTGGDNNTYVSIRKNTTPDSNCMVLNSTDDGVNYDVIGDRLKTILYGYEGILGYPAVVDGLDTLAYYGETVALSEFDSDEYNSSFKIRNFHCNVGRGNNHIINLSLEKA